MPLHLVIPTFTLFFAVYSDLRSHSIYNKMLLASCLLALIQNFYFFGTAGVVAGFLGAGFAFVLTWPLYLLKILGAGDVKLLAVLGLYSSSATVFNIILLSFLWASLVGVIYAFINGSAKELFKNIFRIIRGEKKEKIQAHQLPFAVPIFLAWMSHVFMSFQGVTLWSTH